MGKHRKNQQYRRMVIAAVAVGAVGVPTAAVACANWGGGDSAKKSAESSHRSTRDWLASATRPYQSDQRPDGNRTSPTPGPAAPKTTEATPSVRHRTAPTGTGHRGHTAAPTHRAPAHTSAPRPKPAATHVTASAKATAPAPVKTAVTASATTPAPSTPAPAATASGAVAQVVQLVNAERAKVGCSALTVNPELGKAAQAHSDDMAAHQNMSHDGSDGSAPGDRITAAGYQWSAYGENVAYGYSTPQEVMAGWMASPGHRENILNCSFKEIGVGLAQPGSYWTQDFGTAR